MSFELQGRALVLHFNARKLRLDIERCLTIFREPAAQSAAARNTLYLLTDAKVELFRFNADNTMIVDSSCSSDDIEDGDNVDDGDDVDDGDVPTEDTWNRVAIEYLSGGSFFPIWISIERISGKGSGKDYRFDIMQVQNGYKYMTFGISGDDAERLVESFQMSLERSTMLSTKQCAQRSFPIVDFLTADKRTVELQAVEYTFSAPASRSP